MGSLGSCVFAQKYASRFVHSTNIAKRGRLTRIIVLVWGNKFVNLKHLMHKDFYHTNYLLVLSRNGGIFFIRWRNRFDSLSENVRFYYRKFFGNTNLIKAYSKIEVIPTQFSTEFMLNYIIFFGPLFQIILVLRPAKCKTLFYFT